MGNEALVFKDKDKFFNLKGPVFDIVEELDSNMYRFFMYHFVAFVVVVAYPEWAVRHTPLPFSPHLFIVHQRYYYSKGRNSLSEDLVHHLLLTFF